MAIRRLDKSDLSPRKNRMLKWWGSIFVVVGILILFITGTIQSCVIHGNFENLGEIPKKLFDELGIALIVAGSVTIVIETSHYTKYFVEKLTEVMTTSKYIELLSLDEKKGLKTKLEENIYFSNKVPDPNSFFHLIQKETTKLLDGYYYKEYLVRIDCRVEKEYIFKKIYKKIVVVNPVTDGSQKPLRIPFISQIGVVKGLSPEEQFQVKKFKVGFKDIEVDSGKNFKPKLSEDKKYVECEFDYEISVDEKETIEMLIENKVPLTELYYTSKVTRPCKYYNILFDLYSDAYELMWDCYDFLNTEENSERLMVYPSENCVEIKFNDWIIPGNGVVIGLKPKDK